jgi:hypothetical protein
LEVKDSDMRKVFANTLDVRQNCVIVRFLVFYASTNITVHMKWNEIGCRCSRHETML